MATKVGSVSNSNFTALHAHRPVYFFAIASSFATSRLDLNAFAPQLAPFFCRGTAPIRREYLPCMQPERVGPKANFVTCKKNVVELPDRMSALGHKQTCAAHKLMSALPPKADICSAPAHVCFGPIADIGCY